MSVEEMIRIRDQSSWGTMTYALWNQAIKERLATEPQTEPHTDCNAQEPK